MYCHFFHVCIHSVDESEEKKKLLDSTIVTNVIRVFEQNKPVNSHAQRLYTKIYYLCGIQNINHLFRFDLVEFSSATSVIKNKINRKIVFFADIYAISAVC